MFKFVGMASLAWMLTLNASGRNWSFEPKSPTDTIQTLIARSTSFNGKDPDSIRFYAQRALTLANQYKLDSLVAQAETNLGVAWLYQADYDSALFYFEMSLERTLRLHDSVQMIRNYSNIGIINYYQAHYDEAIDNFIKAANIGEEINSNNLASFYSNIGSIFEHVKDFPQAKKYNLLSIKNQEPGGQVSYAPAKLIDIHYNMEAYDSALRYAEKAVAYYRERDFDMGLASSYRYQAKTLMKLDRLSEAEALFHQSADIYRDRKMNDELAYSYILMADLAIQQDQYHAALQTAEEALKASTTHATRISVNDLRHRAYQKLGDFQSALSAHEELVFLQDSIEDAEESNRVNELLTQYETEKKEAQIASLEQQNQIQELQIGQQRIWLYAGLVIGALLLILGWIAYRQLKLRKRQDELKLQQKLLRVQMNPHFLYNALNAIQKLIYWNDDRKKTADCLAQFSQLTRQILEFNQYEFISLEQELSFIENYLEVQRMRYDPSFTYKIEVDESLEIDELRIPPMITQPFLENAIEHGLAQKSEPGRLSLKINQQQEQLQIVIEDNGVGIATATTLADTAPHQSLATTITQNRLLMLRKSLKKKAELWIQDLREEEQTSGTRVNFSLPMIYG